MTKHREADLPRTPYSMPSKDLKRSVSFGEEEDSPQEGEANKRKVMATGHSISPAELMKAWESILDQIDWSEVVQDVGGRGKPNIYRDVFQTIVQAHIEEDNKEGDEDTDTESGNDSEDGAADGSQRIEDTFVESDESESGSEDYTDDEDDDEEDSDDEYQNDDDYEVIDNEVSV